MAVDAIELTMAAAEIGPCEYVLTLGGELDLHTAPRLRESLDALFAQGATTLVLDLRAATFVDSTGLGVITRAAKRARAGDGDLVLACDSPEILRVFRLTGFDRFLTIRPSFTDVLAELRARST